MTSPQATTRSSVMVMGLGTDQGRKGLTRSPSAPVVGSLAATSKFTTPPCRGSARCPTRRGDSPP
jgi:hypothetical protein